ncbi:TBC1 domain family member 7-like [Pomacea canaliculata]|uniref:TBC1 domain family member 7-like n=1 Tax=Pomacea canaliculata TaxID=400727 RepID=UPI000D727D7E|nr:TBC1 domain family member 7-like [Pomacea canaliculata]
MAAEERNFRSYYYEKFGFRTVEEKKSVEILLKEQHINLEKLRFFCLRFALPAVYRTLVWKILLGVLPPHQSSHDFVLAQRKEQLKDLKQGLSLLNKGGDIASPEVTLLKLFLLERGQLPFQDIDMMVSEKNKGFVAIAHAVCNIADSDFDRYWISSRFSCPEATLRCLKKEDPDHKLCHHLQEHYVLTSLPLIDWFTCCFASVLPDISFERVWDKVIGGSTFVLVYVAVSILIFFRRPLLSMKSSEEMVAYLRHIPEDCGDIIVNQALDLWTQNGSQLMSSKSDSPNVDKSRN